MNPKRVSLPDRRVWLRVAAPAWADPLDPSHARHRGGRWNAPGSYPVLYLNGDIATARMQIERMLAGSPVTMDDLDDGAYLLIAATLPAAQTAADAVTDAGLRALGLPSNYPLERHGKNGKDGKDGKDGEEVGYDVCQPVGHQVRERGLRGVWSRSACTSDGRGREYAWFPATDRSRARPVWARPLPLGAWRHAAGWSDVGLDEQPEPKG